MLGLLAIVPLVGLAFLAVGRLSDVNRANNELWQLDVAASELIELAELESALQREHFWSAVAGALDKIDEPQPFMADLLGVDPTVEATRARERTDRLVDAVALAGLAPAVAESRQRSTVLTETSQVLDVDAEHLVAQAFDWKSSEVILLAAPQREGASLISRAQTLEAASDFLSGLSALRAAYVANLGLDADGGDGLAVRRLSNAATDYSEVLASLQVGISAADPIAESLAVLENDSAWLELTDAIDRFLTDAYSRADLAAAFDADPSLLLPTAPSLLSVDGVWDRHPDLIEDAGDALTANVDRARASASRDGWVVAVVLIAVSVFTVGGIIITTRWIVRPLTALGGSALALTESGEGVLLPASGPAEIRLIHEALAEAISNLERAEKQAIALAVGDLGHPMLEQVVPGRLGATLHAAIEQLRHSISDQERFSDRLAYEASHDGLTGLANRRASLEFLSSALGIADGRLTSVFFLDLDHFKELNDSLGHAAGDAVLREVAKELQAGARSDDLVGRLGGDEFLVVSRGPVTAEDAQAVGERILTALRRPLGESDQIGASIGIAMGTSGSDVDELLAEADIAMLEAKKRGRDAIRFFDSELRGRTIDELTLAAEIRSGLADGAFELHYQPIVDAVSGLALHYEALIRWNRDGLGHVSPDEYIPFAERSDLVIEIDRWVLRTAAQTLIDNRLRGVGVAVNISGRHLANGDLFGDLTTVLQQTSIDPSSLTIEITESALLGDIDGAIETLRRIRETGVKVAIDDFGTGFTSLTHLRRLPADVLKIDQSFTNNIDRSDDANLIRLVIQTAHILGFDVVVEGVETQQQAQRVTILGADQMQGYYFARPRALDEIAEALAEIDDRPGGGDSIRTNPTTSHR